jgi:hypothetical protein
MKPIVHSRLIPLILVILAAIVQNSHLLTVKGIQPNILLIVLVSLAFFTSEFFFFSVLMLVALVTTELFSGGLLTMAVLFALGAGVFLVKDHLPWKSWFNQLGLIMVGTFLFYLLIDIKFLQFDTTTVAWEVMYNSILGAVAFLLLSRFYIYEGLIRSRI